MRDDTNTHSAYSDWSIIGWQEHIALPDFDIDTIKAKIDTGARTSALHAVDLKQEDVDGVPHISFHIPRSGVPRTHRDRAPLVDKRDIKNTSGVVESRYVIETLLLIGKRKWRIEVSLADREEMVFDIILGRTAIRRHKLMVAPGKSFLIGQPVARRPK
nr:RimK/LysX family protein [Ahrensia sp. R2A130]